MNLEEWQREIADAYRNQEMAYPDELRKLVESEPNPATEDKNKQKIADVVRVMRKHFWAKAAKGQTFGDVGRVTKKFGKTLEANYGLNSGPFMDIARAYWTYKIEKGDLFPENKNKWICHALSGVEINIGTYFFPTPGPLSIRASARRAAQREILEEFAPQIDIERFLRENPILQSDSRSGCLGVVAAVGVGVAGMIGYVFYV